MRIRFQLSFIILFSFFGLVSNAQDTLVLLNGERVLLDNSKKTDTSSFYCMNEHGKIKKVDAEYVFSIINKNGKEHVLYKPDSSEENTFNIDQMRSYIFGESVARKDLKSPFNSFGYSVGGFFMGSCPLFVVPPTLLCVAPLVPASYSAVVGLTKTSQKRIKNKYPQYSTDKHFVLGYQEITQNKRTKNAIVGGAVGFVAGLVAVIIISSSK